MAYERIDRAYMWGHTLVSEEEFHKRLTERIDGNTTVATQCNGNVAIGYLAGYHPAIITLTLPNGLELKGKKEDVLKGALAMGYTMKDLYSEKEYYESASKGMLLIKDMQTTHLINSSHLKVKEYMEYVKKVSKTGREYVDNLTSFAELSKFPNLKAMLQELNSTSRANKDKDLK